jgi:predicted dehydrogenase
MLRVGIHGANGHQVHARLADHPRARLVACSAFPIEKLRPVQRAQARSCATLDELLAAGDVDLVSLCSPRRADQADDAVRCLRAGAHVLAEKPAALDEGDLDRVLEVAVASGRRFHEMAGTAFRQPYPAMRRVIADGGIGTVVQVFAQKSYPWHAGRPHDESIDGGLLRQAAIHAVRQVEQVALGRVAEVIDAVETSLGDPGGCGLRMAASMTLRLESGALASVIANYLNQPGSGGWSNEHLRIFGTRGFVESVDGGRRTRLVVGEQDRGPLDQSEPSRDWLDPVVDSLLDGAPMPHDSETELHPLRVCLRAKAMADARPSRGDSTGGQVHPRSCTPDRS